MKHIFVRLKILDFCTAEKVKGAATAASEKSCRRRGHGLAAVYGRVGM
jgi:hypothetical protein